MKRYTWQRRAPLQVYLTWCVNKCTVREEGRHLHTRLASSSKMVVPKNEHLVSQVVVSPGCEVFSMHTYRFISSLCSVPALKKGFRNFKIRWQLKDATGLHFLCTSACAEIVVPFN